MDDAKINAIVDAVVRELLATKAQQQIGREALASPRLSPSPAAPVAQTYPAGLPRRRSHGCLHRNGSRH